MAEVPQDPKSELWLLSTLAAPGNEHLASQHVPRLCPEDFLDPRRKIVFEALRSCVASRVEPSHPVLWQSIESSGKAGLIGGFGGLDEILGAPEVADPTPLVESLINKRRCRELMRAGQVLMRSAEECGADASAIASEVQHVLKGIVSGGGKLQSRTGMDILTKMAHGEALARPGDAKGGSWGDTTLDACVPIPRGEFVSFGARPGVGKTSMMVQAAVASARAGFVPLVLSLESCREKLEARMAAHICRVPFHDLERGKYNAQQVNLIGDEAATLQRIRYMDPPSHTPWSTLEAAIRYETESHGVNLVLLDQFDKIGRGQVGQGSTEAYAFGRVSESLMGMVKDLGIGFVLLCQLKNEDGATPTLGSHADSDRPGKDAGLVMHVYRSRDEKLWLKVQKNRNGGWVEKVWPIYFDGGLQRMCIEERDTSETPKRGI